MSEQQNGRAVTTAEPQAVVPRWAAALPADVLATAEMAVATGWYKDVQTVAQAAFKVMIGRELGVSTIESLQYVHVIPPRGDSGSPKIQLGYPILAALVEKSGRYRYEVEEKTPERCAVAFYRNGGFNNDERKLGVSSFTMEQARNAGLVRDRSPWTSYPETMLFARALTHGVKTYCPSVLSGTDVDVEQPYFEGVARLAGDPVDPPAEVTGPPEGFGNPWASFWATARELGLDKGVVHDLFSAGPEDGDLKAVAEARAESEGRTLAEVVAAMEDALRAAAPRLDDAIEAIPEEDYEPIGGREPQA